MAFSSGATVTVTVTASDTSGLSASESWVFSTTPATTPISFKLSVDRIDTIAAPKSRFFKNPFDSHASMLSLSRLRGEKNKTLKRRALDAAAKPSGSSYEGLIYGITRELGLSTFTPIQINPKTTGGAFNAPDPYILIKGKYIYLYSDYANGHLDHQLDRHTGGGNYETLGALAAFINTTTYFEAHLDVAYVDTRSMTIFDQDSRVFIDGEYTDGSTKFKLKFPYVVANSLFFDNRSSFATLRSTEAEVVSPGDFYIDRQTGIVTAQMVPDRTVARYSYTKYPFSPIASPIVLYDITHDAARDALFDNEIPTILGADIITELMSAYPSGSGV